MAFTQVGNPAQSSLFAYETGADLATGTAPARRVAFFFSDNDGNLTQIITRTLGAAYPYQAAALGREPARLLFEGEPDRVAFVTAAPPFPGAESVAFTAVTLGLSTASA